MEDTELIKTDIVEYLKQHQKKDLLRFVAVGSVDDGKSTLIGRLLHDTHGVYEDQLNAVRRASTRTGMEVDFSLFTDGLKAEREQGITIDVAYRYFSTAKRKFIIADTPGHVQYTRNMATGASTANVCIILIDARLGVLQQSRRHAYIASLLGIPQLVVCINKMDLVDHGQSVFDEIRATFSGFSNGLGFKGTTYIPVSALNGDNIVHESKHMDWYRGPTLLSALETIPVVQAYNFADFRFPVQYVMRPDLDYRGFSGAIASGVVRRGDSIMVLPSGKRSRIAAIDTFDGQLERAAAPMSVTLRLTDEIDISRGDMLVHPENRPRTGRRFDAMVVWMSEKPLDRARSYLLKHTTQIVRAEVETIAHTINLETLSEEPAAQLQLNDIGRVTLSCHRPLHCDPYSQNRSTGAFVLIDALTNATVAAGMVIREAQEGEDAPDGQAAHETSAAPSHRTEKSASGTRAGARVSRGEREARLEQRGCVVWLTGATAPDQTKLAFALERALFDARKLAIVVVPEEGSSGIGVQGRPAVSRTLELARGFMEAGLIVIVTRPGSSAIERDVVSEAVGGDRFIELQGGGVDALVKELAQRGMLS